MRVERDFVPPTTDLGGACMRSARQRPQAVARQLPVHTKPYDKTTRGGAPVVADTLPLCLRSDTTLIWTFGEAKPIAKPRTTDGTLPNAPELVPLMTFDARTSPLGKSAPPHAPLGDNP